MQTAYAMFVAHGNICVILNIAAMLYSLAQVSLDLSAGLRFVIKPCFALSLHLSSTCLSKKTDLVFFKATTVFNRLPAEIFSNYEAKLTAGFSQTYTAGINTGISVTAQPYQHGTVIRGQTLHSSCPFASMSLSECLEMRL